MDLQAVKVYLNQLGTTLSTMDVELAAARGDGIINAHVVGAHDALARAGRAAAAIAGLVETAESAAKAAEAPPPVVLPTGRIVQVGEADAASFTGDVDPLTLTQANWRYWANHPELWPHAGQIFSGPYRLGDPAKGPDHLYGVGDLASGEQDPGPLTGR